MLDSKRPTSPHLTVYTIQFGSFFSIFSRVTGLILTLVLAIVIFLAYFTKYGNTHYIIYSVSFILVRSTYLSFFTSFFILLVLISFYYHLFSSTRYISWFFGVPVLKMELNTIRATQKSHITLGLLSLVFAVFTFIFI